MLYILYTAPVSRSKYWATYLYKLDCLLRIVLFATQFGKEARADLNGCILQLLGHYKIDSVFSSNL
mgnify:CR=1 FL=1